MSALAVLLNDEDIAILNAVRTILDGVKKRTPYTFQGGVIYEAAIRGDDAVFQVLNTVHHYGHQPMTDGQLHNHDEAAMVAP